MSKHLCAASSTHINVQVFSFYAFCGWLDELHFETCGTHTTEFQQTVLGEHQWCLRSHHRDMHLLPKCQQDHMVLMSPQSQNLVVTLHHERVLAAVTKSGTEVQFVQKIQRAPSKHRPF